MLDLTDWVQSSKLPDKALRYFCNIGYHHSNKSRCRSSFFPQEEPVNHIIFCDKSYLEQGRSLEHGRVIGMLTEFTGSKKIALRTASTLLATCKSMADVECFCIHVDGREGQTPRLRTIDCIGTRFGIDDHYVASTIRKRRQSQKKAKGNAGPTLFLVAPPITKEKVTMIKHLGDQRPCELVFVSRQKMKHKVNAAQTFIDVLGKKIQTVFL